jgi:hypothetical protein
MVPVDTQKCRILKIFEVTGMVFAETNPADLRYHGEYSFTNRYKFINLCADYKPKLKELVK